MTGLDYFAGAWTRSRLSSQSLDRLSKTLTMRILTYAESADWWSHRGYPTRQHEGYIVGPDPDIQAHEFPRVEFTLPTDSGRRVWLAQFLYGLVDPSPELLIWLGDWAVWPSAQHAALYPLSAGVRGTQTAHRSARSSDCA